MGLILEYEEGETPLDEDEKEGLLIPTIATRGELDEFEQQNIENAMLFYWNRSISFTRFFTEDFVKEVHRKMYGDVWRWAGEFRKTNKNIGVDKWQVQTDLKSLLDDAYFWVQNKVYSPDEIAVRFKHRIVSIHCFPNGNGRHSRLMADLLIYGAFKEDEPFSWGGSTLVKKSEARDLYLKALKEADKGNIQPLIQFAKS